MRRIRILVAEARDFPPKAAALLESVGSLTLGDFDRPTLLSEVENLEVLWVRLRHYVDAEIMSHAPRLRVIATPTTGLNHIDLKATEERGISVLSLRGETDFLKNIRATAEHTVGLTLALLRRIPDATQHALGGKWNRDLFKGSEIFEKTVGIIGYGRLGRIVADYFSAFGAQVFATDPAMNPGEIRQGLRIVPLPDLLAQSDIVSLHVNLTTSTYGFFDKSCFAMMKRGSFLINTARGELIDEVAFLEAIQNGHVTGAALDVLSGELDCGFESHPFLQYAAENSNLIITPHIGGCTRESTERTEEFLAEKVANFIRERAFHVTYP
jgi:D-3-phosphoglycerate dehydrogenase / 2-oxoglutarate reductase